MNNKVKNTLCCTAVTSLFLAAVLCQAQGVEDRIALPQDSMRTSIKLNAGWPVSAVGLGGISVGYSLLRNMEIEGAVGYGISGIQLSLMPKLSIGSPAHRFVAGAGVVMGLPVADEAPQMDISTSFWGNLDLLGYEYRGPSGLVISISAGMTVGLVGTYKTTKFSLPLFYDIHDTQEVLEKRSIAGIILPQARIGIGYRF